MLELGMNDIITIVMSFIH